MTPGDRPQIITAGEFTAAAGAVPGDRGTSVTVASTVRVAVNAAAPA